MARQHRAAPGEGQLRRPQAPEAKAWLAANPRVICHFTPTHASWMNLVVGDLGEEHGHRVLRVHGKGGKVVLVPLPPALGRAIDRAVDKRTPDRSC